MTMHPTSYLEHHAEVFAANLLHKHGLTLDQYLASPQRYEFLLQAEFPLLPAQTQVRARLIHEEILREPVEEIAKTLDGLPFKSAQPHQRHQKPRRSMAINRLAARALNAVARFSGDRATRKTIRHA
ncbi:hypothetical protein [Marinobacter sp. MCTG268]|uniref:hypothetical protein n=1 Tax=Marinobacter adhaerens TaxID=1033846 RepID=UPI00056D6ECB